MSACAHSKADLQALLVLPAVLHARHHPHHHRHADHAEEAETDVDAAALWSSISCRWRTSKTALCCMGGRTSPVLDWVRSLGLKAGVFLQLARHENMCGWAPFGWSAGTAGRHSARACSGGGVVSPALPAKRSDDGAASVGGHGYGATAAAAVEALVRDHPASLMVLVRDGQGRTPLEVGRACEDMNAATDRRSCWRAWRRSRCTGLGDRRLRCRPFVCERAVCSSHLHAARQLYVPRRSMNSW